MTELNQQPDPDVPAASAPWPALPTLAATVTGTAPQRTGDRDVDDALEVLAAVPAMPVPEHGVVYAEVHDALLEALNAEHPSIPEPPSIAAGRSAQDDSEDNARP